MTVPDHNIDLPAVIPLFPLSGVVLLPRGQLPLNIFEPRYLAMIDSALKSDRMIGMVQPRCGEDHNDLYEIGCAGRITSFSEADDGRYLITLTGVSRFRVGKELALTDGYRRGQLQWDEFSHDLKGTDDLEIDRGELKPVLRTYFDTHEIHCDWEMIEQTPDEKLITCLTMICPFSPNEKQALLEARCPHDRTDKFITMLKMSLHGNHCGSKDDTGCH